VAFCGKRALCNDVRGKIVQEEIDASKEKGSKKEETLSKSERDLAAKVLKGLSEKNLSGGFLFLVEVAVVEYAGSC
jgi:hypothetical protein